MFLNDQMLDSGALARRLLAPANNLVPVNLLTRQQASLEDAGTAGWAAAGNCTIARSTTYAASGAASLLVTTTAAGSPVPATSLGSAGIPVVPGRTYTAVAKFRNSVGSRSGYVRIYWYTGDTYTSASDGPLVTLGATWGESRITAIAPAGVTHAAVVVTATSGSTSDAYYVDQVGLWEGAGGSWVNGGERLDPSTLGLYWDESVGRRLFVWDTINSRWQMVYGDTGWRDVTSSLINGWVAGSGGSYWIRRIGNVVHHKLYFIVGTAQTSTTLMNIPTGFAPTTNLVRLPIAINQSAQVIVVTPTSLLCSVSAATVTDMTTGFSYPTNDAWPTSLPGTAVGSIPNA